ncbi:sensor histidine kinase [Nitrosococcus wardiae]|uniref:histidine kinase n=1 Tax=Nitrosococcus wardiae TaxID=1814290 RepID=A0A4P7BTH8_9GAMM|nr:ATP-binding protein [Nitrosococcus wardiae]QBQ53171.1 HAMP domain-containing protein [Nitrosococcus wardiae]
MNLSASLGFKRLFSDLALKWKITSVTIPLIIAILLLGYALSRDKGQEIEFTQKETYGIEYTRALRDLMQAFMEHRGLASLYLSSNPKVKDQLEQKKKEIRERIQAVEEEEAKHGATLDTTEEWRNIQAHWEQLQHQVVDLSPKESIARHNSLITLVIDLIAKVKHSSNLTLDPHTDSYYLVDTIQNQLPNLINTIGMLRVVAVKTVGNSQVSEKDKTDLIGLQKVADLYKRQVGKNLNIVIENTPALRPRLEQSAEEFSKASNHFFNLINKSLLAGANNRSASEAYNTATQAVNAGFYFFDTASLSLNELLQERIAKVKQEQYITLGGIILFVTFAIGVGFMVIGAITRPIQRAQFLSMAIASGNLENSIESNSNDEVGRMLLSLSDMQKKLRQQIEKERHHLEELEEKNAELERFIYTVSHDLRSPLITIKGFSGMLKRSLSQGDREQMQGDIKRIQAAADNMQLLLDDLLELSRIGRLVNPPEKVSLENLAREAIELVKGAIIERNVQVEIAPNLPFLIGDRKRLLEVMQNLIENAVKFMGDQKEPRIEINALEREGELLCYVRDNGMGISSRYHEKIFDLFDRLNQNVEGTGIGLAIVKRIIEVHEGRVWVESEGPGQGSTFYFSIPKVPA